jgi:hypothetical protein
MVDRDRLGQVAAPPSGGRQVIGQQALLADEEQQPAESADAQERRSPDHAGARQETQHLGCPGIPQRGPVHRRIDRIGPAPGPDQRPGRDEPEPGIGIEGRRRPGQRPGLPPGVVVAERDVRGPGAAGSLIARDRSGVAGEHDDLDTREASAHRVGAAVAGAVIDDDDRRALGKFAEPAERPEQFLAAVAGGDHHRDAAPRAYHIHVVPLRIKARPA